MGNPGTPHTSRQDSGRFPPTSDCHQTCRLVRDSRASVAPYIDEERYQPPFVPRAAGIVRQHCKLAAGRTRSVARCTGCEALVLARRPNWLAIDWKEAQDEGSPAVILKQAPVAERYSHSRLRKARDRSMPSMLPFLYDRKRSDQSFDTEPLVNFDNADEEFSVSWVAHRYEARPVAVEHCVVQDLDQIVESCRARLAEMRDKHPTTPPDGFLVFNGGGSEVRRWFGTPRPKA
jgi:hypothetical protein